MNLTPGSTNPVVSHGKTSPSGARRPNVAASGNITIGGTIGGTGTISTTGTTGIINTTGLTGTIGGTGTISTTGTTGIGFAVSNLYKVRVQSMSPDLPPIEFSVCDENCNNVKMTLKPESAISVGELSKILLLSLAYAHAPDKFNTLAYVKHHNLEKHFTYA